MPDEMKFYIGSEDGSGLEYDTLDEFLECLTEKAAEARDSGKKYFTITIEEDE